MGELEELQAYVRKFEAHLNDLELELHDQGWQLHEARQQVERLRKAVQLVVDDGTEFKLSNGVVIVVRPVKFEALRAALAADSQPAEADGEG